VRVRNLLIDVPDALKCGFLRTYNRCDGVCFGIVMPNPAAVSQMRDGVIVALLVTANLLKISVRFCRA